MWHALLRDTVLGIRETIIKLHMLLFVRAHRIRVEINGSVIQVAKTKEK
jgi:hypothetical protein